MSKSLSCALLEARILRYLLTQGRPCDFSEIRSGAELGKFARAKTWTVIRSLIDARWISYAYAIERSTFEGFEQSLSYPVFWINRENLLARDRHSERRGAQWWAAVLAPMGGEEVQP
jgi:hypothetical protein